MTEPLSADQGANAAYAFDPGLTTRVKAHQHLNRDGEQTTLCGFPFADMQRDGDMHEGNKVYDYHDGYDPRHGPGCEPCQAAADLINR